MVSGELPLAEVFPQSDPKGLEPLNVLDLGGYIVVPLVARGRTLGLLSLFVDRARRRLDAEDLALASALAERSAMAIDNALLYREAQDASHSREELLAVVSHDLKNPLNAIIIGIQNLAKALPEGATRARQQIAPVERAAGRMNHLIRDLLDAARVEAGHFAVTRRMEDAAAIVGEVLDLERPRR